GAGGIEAAVVGRLAEIEIIESRLFDKDRIHERNQTARAGAAVEVQRAIKDCDGTIEARVLDRGAERAVGALPDPADTEFLLVGDEGREVELEILPHRLPEDLIIESSRPAVAVEEAAEGGVIGHRDDQHGLNLAAADQLIHEA